MGGCVVCPLKLGAILKGRSLATLRRLAGVRVRDLEAEVGRDLEAVAVLAFGLLDPPAPVPLCGDRERPPTAVFHVLVRLARQWAVVQVLEEEPVAGLLVPTPRAPIGRTRGATLCGLFNDHRGSIVTVDVIHERGSAGIDVSAEHLLFHMLVSCRQARCEDGPAERGAARLPRRLEWMEYSPRRT